MKNYFDLTGQVAVVTGASTGLGVQMAKALANQGANIVCLARRKEKIDANAAAIAEEFGVKAIGVQCDITDTARVEAAVDEILAEFGRIDILINNAGVGSRGKDIFGTSRQEFEDHMMINAYGPWCGIQKVAPVMKENGGGSIVNISSSRDRMSQPQTESYTAAKGGISALTHALAISLAGRARVNSISPGWIDTTGSNIDGADAIQQPAGRVGKPEDIAEMVLFLCSEKAGFITGENICIDGGMTKQMIYHGEHGWTYGEKAHSWMGG